MRSLVGGLVVALSPLGLLAQTGPESDGSRNAPKEVDTILATHCVSCHGPDQKRVGSI